MKYHFHGEKVYLEVIFSFNCVVCLLNEFFKTLWKGVYVKICFFHEYGMMYLFSLNELWYFVSYKKIFHFICVIKFVAIICL